jgi:hypothetical protein
MSAGGAFGYQQSKTDQSSSSTAGISREYKGAVSRDAYEGSQRLSDMSRQYAESPFGYFQGQNIRDMVPQNQYGLPVQTTEALAALGNQWFSKASAGGAMRGQVTPENTNQIVGSSMLNASQFLMPHILQNQQYLNALPDQLASQRLGYLQADQASKAGLLGSQSDAMGKTRAFGFDIQASTKV